MLDHHIQRSIVYRLAFAPEGLRFSELKPDDLDSKLFTYHLKKVVSAKYVEKLEDGCYSLTHEGRRLGTRIFDKQLSIADRAESVLFLVIKRKGDGAWLLYKRTVHPLIGRIGFMHASPQIDLEVASTASLVCKEKTGLDCEFSIQGGGYFKVFDGEELESFTHFTLMVCDDASGELVPTDKKAEYFWDTNPDFNSPAMLPNMATLAGLYDAGELFFVEKTFQLDR